MEEEEKKESDWANSFNAPLVSVRQAGQSRFNQHVNEFKLTWESTVKTAWESKWKEERKGMDGECSQCHLLTHPLQCQTKNSAFSRGHKKGDT